MKQKIIITLLCISLIAISTVIGFNMGVDKQKKEAIQNIMKNELQQKEAKKVAIVNMDEGVRYDNEVMNYGTTLLSTIPLDYVVTGLEDARSGLLTGKYKSYVILPTTFSKNVESINSQPQQTLVEYAISALLKDKEREAAIYDVQEIYDTLKTNISRIYIATVLGEFHRTQDSALTILDNDKKDMELLQGVSGYDLREIIDIPELKMVENNILPLDLETQYAKNEALLGNIDESYKTSLAQSKEDAEIIKGHNQVLTDKNTMTGQALESVETTQNNSQSMEAYDDTVQMESENNQYHNSKNSIDTMNEAHNKKIETHNDLLNKHNIRMKNTIAKYDYTEQAYRNLVAALDARFGANMISNETEVEYGYSIEGVPQTIAILENKYTIHTTTPRGGNANESLSDYYTSQSQAREDIAVMLENMNSRFMAMGEASVLPADYSDWQSYVNVLFPAPVQVENETLVQDGEQELTLTIPKEDIQGPQDVEYVSDVDVLNSETISRDVETIVGTAKKGRTERNTKITQKTTMYTNYQNDMKTGIAVLSTSYKMAQAEHMILSGFIATYDPLTYIKERELSEYRSSIDQNNSETQSIISEQNSQYEKYVGDVAQAASENTTAQTEAIAAGQKASDEKLENGLAQAKDSRTNTSGINSDLLYSLTLKLPYTRVGAVENRTAYNVMSNPVHLQNKSALLANSKQKERNIKESTNFTEITIIAIAVLALLIALTAILAGKRKQMAGEF